MRKLFAASSAWVQLLKRAIRLKLYGCISVVFLVGCTATHVQWDAKQMRERVMDYYNDEIMDNIIRMHVDELPFIHVDISTMTAIATSQLSGTVGGGETRTNATASLSGVIGTITHTVMRPFTYSVSPQRGESLSITAAPVIGSPAGDTSEPDKKPIYKAYYDFVVFLKSHKDALVYSEGLIPPSKGEYVPGTLKRYGTGYYYILNRKDYKEEYRQLCMKLFTQSRPKPSLKEFDELRDTGERVQGLQALPPPP
jgi:hypothetical protein